MLVFSEIFSTTTTEYLGTTGSYEAVIHLRFNTLCTDFDHDGTSDFFSGSASLLGDVLAQIYTFSPSFALIAESSVTGVLFELTVVKSVFDTAASTGQCVLSGSASFETFDAEPISFSFTSLDMNAFVDPLVFEGTTAIVGSIDGAATFYAATTSVEFTEVVARAFSILRDGPCETTPP